MPEQQADPLSRQFIQCPGNRVGASFKLGVSLLELNHTADGIIQLQHTKDAYPGTPAARLARQKLESLGLM